MHFRATLQLDGTTATGITVPEQILRELGDGKRHRLRVTLGDHTFRTTTGSMGGAVKIPVSAAVRAAAGVAAGDELDVVIEPDTEPREVVLPAVLAAALAADQRAGEFYQQLPPGQQKAYVTWVESAKRPETRERRVTETVARLAAGKAQR